MEDILTLLPYYFNKTKDIIHLHQINKNMYFLFNNDKYIVTLLDSIINILTEKHNKLPQYTTFLFVFNLNESKYRKRLKNITCMKIIKNIISIKDIIEERIYLLSILYANGNYIFFTREEILTMFSCINMWVFVNKLKIYMYKKYKLKTSWTYRVENNVNKIDKFYVK